MFIMSERSSVFGDCLKETECLPYDCLALGVFATVSTKIGSDQLAREIIARFNFDQYTYTAVKLRLKHFRSSPFRPLVLIPKS